MQLDDEPQTPAGAELMDHEQFDREAALLGEGRHEELGLDPLPENWAPASIDELRDE